MKRRATLTPEQVAEIRRRRSHGEKLDDIAAAVGSTRKQVSAVALGKIYKPPELSWPLANVWLGVSIEDQATADARIPLLLHTPAAVRWVSYEPALASVDFSRWVFDRKAEVNRLINGPAMLNRDQAEASVSYPLDWLVVGGESGRDARPPHPNWFRSARDQCQAVGVPFFFKQWGEWREHPEPPMRGYNNGAGLYVLPSGKFGNQGDYWSGAAAGMDKVGKKAAGARLDGREWQEFPR